LLAVGAGHRLFDAEEGGKWYAPAKWNRLDMPVSSIQKFELVDNNG
jgi:hypothetical protein